MRIARRGFSLVELLVVIGIIAILAGILIPVVTAARNSAHETASKAMISSLSSAIEMYHTTFRGYPGAFRNDDLIRRQITIDNNDPAVVDNTGAGAEAITMTESLTLALLGGLTLDPGVVWKKSLTDSAAGPDVLNPNAVKRHQAFMQAKPGTLSSGLIASLEDHGIEYNGRAADELDSRIPEFLDGFPDKLPIIYLRARVGAPGIVTATISGAPNPNYQYDLALAKPYLRHDPDTATINDKDGLKTAIDYRPANTDGYGMVADSSGHNRAYQGFAYFRHPQLGGSLNAAGNDNGTPRQKDTYILISAGKDRIFGTRDDITNFGPIAE